MKIEGYGWVTQKDGVDYYRSITVGKKDELMVKDGKKVKLKKKIKDIINGPII